MATATTVINRVVKGFRKASAPDLLTSALTNSPIDQNVHYLGLLSGWGKGAKVEISSEIMLVKDNDPESKIASVVRGWLSTPIENHVVDSPIFIEPRVNRSDILDLFNDALEDMYGQDLFATNVAEFVYEPGSIGYPLPDEAIKPLRVDALMDGASRFWKPIADWFVIDHADEDFGTQQAIMIRVSLPFGAFLRVVYAEAFTPLTSESQDLLVHSGVPTYMQDLLYYFAMNRVMVDLERERSQIQAAQSHQRAQDTPPFLALRTGEWYQARYADRVITARKRLKDEVRVVATSGYGS